MIVHHYNALESTNLHLAKMAEENAPAWTVVIADTQTGGRGRSGRSWWSPPGSLYMSVLIRPAFRSHIISRIPILASLAVLDALKDVGVTAGVKWPNDILVGERKLAGILIQARTEKTRVIWIVVGFGINIHRPEDGVPDEIRDRIAFLKEINRNSNCSQMAEAIVTGLKKRLTFIEDDSWSRAMDEWTGSASWNTVYTHLDGARLTRGIPVRLNEDGGLVLMTDDGEVAVYSGEIIETVQSPKPKGQRART
jgi:BirA family biotin operon repressor/biotin-[acetyl-CoA-carboxylase] ligase